MKNRVKRIGIFTHDFFPLIGGQGRHVYEIYKQSLNDPKQELIIFSPSDNTLKNHVRIFPETQKSKLKNIDFSFKLNNQIEGLISRYNLDIVHLHGGPGGLFLLKKLSVPTLFTSHHTYWQQYNYVQGERWKIFFYFFENLGYKKADKIICVSKDTLKILREKYKIDEKKLRYIPNGINLNKYDPVKRISSKYPELLYVGRIDKRKGVYFLIEAMKFINRENPNIKLHIVGEGRDRIKLEQYSQSNGLNILFHGKLTDGKLNNLYNRVSMQIVPSVFEGFGITVLEGMAKKIPVIGTNVDGIKGIIINEETGLLVNFNDKQLLAEKIEFLSSNPSLRTRISENAYKSLRDYDWKKIYINTSKEYEQFVY